MTVGDKEWKCVEIPPWTFVISLCTVRDHVSENVLIKINLSRKYIQFIYYSAQYYLYICTYIYTLYVIQYCTVNILEKYSLKIN